MYVRLACFVLSVVALTGRHRSVRGRPDGHSVFPPAANGTMILIGCFLKRAGIEMIPVGYKGGSAPMTDLIGGHVPVLFRAAVGCGAARGQRRRSPSRGVERASPGGAPGRSDGE